MELSILEAITLMTDRKRHITMLAKATTAALAVTTISIMNQENIQAQNQSTDEPNPAYDYYHYVNNEWMDSTTNPAYTPIIDDVYELGTNINTMLYYDVVDMVNGQIPVESPEMEQFIGLFNIANDWNRRNELNNDPILPYFENIQNLQSVEDLNE